MKWRVFNTRVTVVPRKSCLRRERIYCPGKKEKNGPKAFLTSRETIINIPKPFNFSVYLTLRRPPPHPQHSTHTTPPPTISSSSLFKALISKTPRSQSICFLLKYNFPSLSFSRVCACTRAHTRTCTHTHAHTHTHTHTQAPAIHTHTQSNTQNLKFSAGVDGEGRRQHLINVKLIVMLLSLCGSLSCRPMPQSGEKITKSTRGPAY